MVNNIKMQTNGLQSAGKVDKKPVARCVRLTKAQNPRKAKITIQTFLYPIIIVMLINQFASTNAYSLS